jgi:hypothetical protein
LVFELVDTLVGGFTWRCQRSGYNEELFSLTIGSTLRGRPLATTSADSHTVDDIALLSLVAETTGFVWSGWTRSAVNDMKLSKLY